MTGLLLALALAAGQPDAAGGVPRGTRPAGCPAGYVCLETKEAADLTVRLADLEAEIAALKARQRSSFGWCFGGGLTVGAMPVSQPGGSFQWKAVAGPSAGVIFAWRPR
jgi:hypothetical protein